MGRNMGMAEEMKVYIQTERVCVKVKAHSLFYYIKNFTLCERLFAICASGAV